MTTLLLAITVALGADTHPTHVDFDTEIVPILTKAGCNTGACHGAAAGRGGFRLSLFGSDPVFDHRSIALELEGRRVNLVEPAESLVLLKPTGTLRHGGGRRFGIDSESDRRFQAWIASGAERSSARRLEKLTMTPTRHVAARPGESITLTATARFDDGSEHDVSEWTVFTAEDPEAIVIEQRVAIPQRPGRHIIIARYLDRVIPIPIILPRSDGAVNHENEPRRNVIDEEILATLTELGLPVSPPADDATFLRRLSLDLTGRLPSPEEVQEFHDDRGPNKRDRWIERLLISEAFTDYWTYQFAKLLRIRPKPNEPETAIVYHSWLRDQIARGTPYDQMARALLTTQGDTHRDGPANFHRTVGGSREQAEFVSELFLGNRLRCANCHDHPLDRWKQDDYHGLAAVFASIERGRVVKTTARGEVIHPGTGERAVPRLPGVRDLDPEGDSPATFAAWLTTPENPYFAKAIVNRLWKSMMGRGLVEPTDDLRETNPATHPSLLDRLAEDFVTHGYDIRHTLRLIARSHAYAQSSRTHPNNRDDDRYYSHALVRPLDPEVLADAIADVTGMPGRYGDLPKGTRAVTLIDPATPSRTLDILGRCGREDTCESSETMTGDLPRMLHLLNGPLLNQRISAPEGRLSQRIDADTDPEQIIEEMYRRALGRTPTRAEQQFWRAELARADDSTQRREMLQDFLWSLLNSREFITNH